MKRKPSPRRRARTAGTSDVSVKVPSFEFKLIADALPELISYVDSGGRYRFNNRAYEEWFGAPRKNLEGRLIEEVIGPGAYENVKTYIARALAGEYVTFEGKLPYSFVGERHVRIDYVPVFDASGRVLGFYCLIIDLTQARRAAVRVERNRVAREIHDSIAQTLAGTIMHLGSAEEVGAAVPKEVLLHIRRAHELARLTLAELRRSLLSLNGFHLEMKDLTGSIRNLVVQFHADTSIRLTFSVTGRPRRLDAVVEEYLFRIAHQAIANAIQHSAANRMKTCLIFQDRNVRLRAVDDGKGFDPSLPNPGLGIRGMRDRSRQIGGTFKLTSRPGRGTRIEVSVPLLKPQLSPLVRKA